MVDNNSQYSGGTPYPAAYTRPLVDGAPAYPTEAYSDQHTAQVARDQFAMEDDPAPLNVGRFAAGIAATAIVGVGLATLLTFLLNQLYISVGAPWALHPRGYLEPVVGALVLALLSAAAFLLLAWRTDSPALIYGWLAGLVSTAGLLVPGLAGGATSAGFLVGVAYAIVTLTITGLTKALGRRGLQLAAQGGDTSPVPLNVGRFAAGVGGTAVVGIGLALLLTFLLNQLYTSVGAPWAVQQLEYTTGLGTAVALTVASAAAFLLLAWLVDIPTLLYGWLAGLVATAGLLVPWLTDGPTWAGLLIGLGYAIVTLTITGLTKALGEQALRNQSAQQRTVI